MSARIPIPPSLAQAPFSLATGLEAGLGRKRLGGSDLDRPFRGVRTVPQPGPTTTDPDERERLLLLSRCSAMAPVLRPGQHFSHETAARLWGCPLPTRFTDSDKLHVSTPTPGRAIRRTAIVGHHVRAPTLDVRDGLPVSDATSTWLALAPTLPLDALIAVGDHLILDPRVLDPYDIRPYVSLTALTAATEQFTGRGAVAAATALTYLRQGAESRPETLVRLILARAGFPEPELQGEIVDSRGRQLGFADLYFREFKVVVEYDGEKHRTNSRQHDRDLSRIDSFIAAGHAVVRIRWRRLFRDQSSIPRLVLEAHERQAAALGLEVPLSHLRSRMKG